MGSMHPQSMVAITPDAQNKLVAGQQQAGEDIRAATAKTDGIGDDIQRTHGSFVFEAVAASKDVEVARRRAGEAIAAAAGRLQAAVQQAASAYAVTDGLAAEQLNKQMRPGG